MIVTPEFKKLAQQVVINAKCLAECLTKKSYKVLTGGTDNHLVLIDIFANGITGVIAERALEECNIIVNKNKIPGDKKSPTVTSGLRLGTNSLTYRGVGRREMVLCADLIHQVLSHVKVQSEVEYELDSALKKAISAEVRELCMRFPIPSYPLASDLGSSLYSDT